MDDKKSTSRYVFSLGIGAVTRTSKKQHAGAFSSTEEEYRGARKGACEAVWLRKMLSYMKMRQTNPTLLLCDNQEVVKLVNILVGSPRLRTSMSPLTFPKI